MSTQNLQELVQRELLSSLESLGFEIVESETGDAFDNAFVILQGPSLRIRIVRDRSQVFADFGPVSSANIWYDSAVLMEYLGLSADAGFHDRDADAVLAGIASFVRTFHHELSQKFAEANLPTTTRELKSLKERRADRLFG